MSALRFELLSSKACNPIRGSEHSAGLDLFAAHPYVIPPWSNALIKTDLRFHIKSGYYAQILPRSGLALRNNIFVNGGVIDRDYTGNVGVILVNLSNSHHVVFEKDRIAQVVCIAINEPQDTEESIRSNRGCHGFGSTN